MIENTAMSIDLVRKLRIALPVAALICCLLGKLFQSLSTVMLVLSVIALILLIANTIISIAFWRCPACGRHLPERSNNIDYCPHCGCPID